MAGRAAPPPDVSEDANNGARNSRSNPPSPPQHELEVESGGGGGRRDENAISFRHFLQPQSDVVPTRHRAQRSGNGSAVDLVDIPMGLPDFVQDQLIAEAQAEALPLDFGPAASPPAASHHYGGHVDQLGAHALSPSATQNHTSSLPDFLSDGPMYYDASNSETGAGPGPCRGSAGETRSEAHLRASSFDSDSLLSQNERLRREVMDKARRISYLESECSRQETEMSGLQAALLNVTESLRLANEGVSGAEAEVTRLAVQVAKLEDEAGSGRLRNGDGDCVAAPLPNGPLNTQSYSQSRSGARVTEIANVTEDLLRQLLDQVRELRAAAVEASLVHSQEEAESRKPT